ncbi:MAG: hypothetical protein IPH83_08460 [Gammaproteobacteria bacterium]|nr:hypothetical protein [Gammaproteobacteria bacterium]
MKVFVRGCCSPHAFSSREEISQMSADIHAQRVLILISDRSTPQLIARRVRELGVSGEIYSWRTGAQAIRTRVAPQNHSLRRTGIGYQKRTPRIPMGVFVGVRC